jgi:hypothetical protein
MKKILILTGINFAFLSFVIVPLLIFIFLTVISIADIYKAFDADLPTLTKSLVGIFSMIVSAWFICLPIMGFAMLAVSGIAGYLLARYDVLKIIIIESIIGFLLTVALLFTAFVTIYIPIASLPAIIL